MRRRIALAGAAAAVAALALTGCVDAVTGTGNTVDVVTIERDGTTIHCAVAGGGGIDCDWSVGE